MHAHTHICIHLRMYAHIICTQCYGAWCVWCVVREGICMYTRADTAGGDTMSSDTEKTGDASCQEGADSHDEADGDGNVEAGYSHAIYLKEPFDDMILDGEKAIEVRSYKAKSFVGKSLVLIRLLNVTNQKYTRDVHGLP